MLRHDWRALPIDDLVELGDLRPATSEMRFRHPEVVCRLVHRGAVFPLVATADGRLLATTCFSRWQPPREDRRARREALREDPTTPEEGYA